MLDTNITKIGNSTYVLIPSYIVEQYKLENGDSAEIILDNDSITINVRKKNVVRG